MKKLLLMLAAVGMVFTACEGGEGLNEDSNVNEDTIPTDRIVIKPTTITVEAAGNNYIVAVSSPCSWRATTEEKWITLETKLGIDGKQQLIFDIKDHFETTERQGKIVVSNSDEGFSTELTVVQKAFVPEWSIETETLTFTAVGGTQEIAISANFDYSYTSNADWISLQRSANGISVTVPDFAETDERTAEITISSEKYKISKVVNVKQSAFEPIFKVVVGEEFEWLNFEEFDYNEGEFGLEVTANFSDWDIYAPDWIWYEIFPSKYDNTLNFVYIVIEPNPTTSSRTGEIVVFSKKYNLSKVIKISQKALVPIFEIEDNLSTLEYDYNKAERTISVDTNFEITITVPDWIKYDIPEVGYGLDGRLSHKVNFQFSTNFSTDPRTGEIVIAATESDLSKVINVKQGAFVPIFEIEEITSLEYDYKGKSKSVAVTSNLEDYDITTTANWIKCNKSDTGVNISLSCLKDADSRTGEVKIFSKKHNFEGRTITITQTPTPYPIGSVYNNAGVVYGFDSNVIKVVYFYETEAIWSEANDFIGTYGDARRDMEKIKKMSKWTVAYPAFYWCNRQGGYLPGMGDMGEMMENLTIINATLEAKGGDTLKKGIEYWTSNEKDDTDAYPIDLSNGLSFAKRKQYTKYVRCVIFFED